jgi:serine/threonine-protein kinase
MEWIDGADLTRYCAPDARLSLDLAVSILARVADALSHAHARGCVHGDIKPANILYAPRDDRVKIADFGAGSPPKSTFRGTPAYMAPEQVCGSIEARSDQFSLGVTLYQLASGAMPFEAPSLPRLFNAIVTEKHGDVRERDPRLPAALAAVLDRLLAKDPCDRYGDMRGAAAAVRCICGSTCG